MSKLTSPCRIENKACWGRSHPTPGSLASGKASKETLKTKLVLSVSFGDGKLSENQEKCRKSAPQNPNIPKTAQTKQILHTSDRKTQ